VQQSCPLVPAQLPIRLRFVGQGKHRNVQTLYVDEPFLFLQINRWLPGAILPPFLEIAHDFDDDALDEQGPEVRADALGGGEDDVSLHTGGETAFDLVSSWLIGLEERALAKMPVG
jgi:hypothetical protein